MTDERHILRVDGWFSKCGSCGKQVLPHEKTHDQISGYGSKEEPGCGVRFTHITSSMAFPNCDRIVESIRPDLIYIGFDAC